MLVNSQQQNPSRIAKGSRIAVRKVLSHYWDNSSVFGIDLVGAVLRQGTFVQKMHKLDWLHSPNIMSTVQRLIVKYHRFVRLAAEHPKQTVVPTLDIDLAWVRPPPSPLPLLTNIHTTAHAPTRPKNILPLHPRRNKILPQPRRQNPRINPPHRLPMDLLNLRKKVQPALRRMHMLVLRMHPRTPPLFLPIQTLRAKPLRR
jgi:hypothetical protein